MRILIATVATATLAAATAAAMVLRTPPSSSPQPAPGAHGLAGADAAWATHAVPGLVWRSGTATLRLGDAPCPSEELTRALDGEGLTEARAYEVKQGSRRYGGCWTQDSGGDVVTIEPGREIGTIPIAWFERARKAG